MTNKLTTQEYWQRYYSKNYGNKNHIISVCSYYDQFWEQLFGDKFDKKSIIEIGGFPGRYLAYLSSKYNLIPTCLDYNTDISEIESTFKTMGVNTYNIIQKDFTLYEPNEQYDFVISNGFIEHFEDYDQILDLHNKYLKPGGKMLIMIPNKRYLRQFYGYLCDYKNLKAHNLNCMNLEVFKAFSKRHNLDVKTLKYYGGFPFAVHQKLNLFQKLIFKTTKLIFKKIINPILMKYPSKYMSASIIGIFNKPLIP